jgi:cob(I)alamin adenosyltransferase
MAHEGKIYTKTGDKGETSLIGGTRVPKHHLRVEAYGTLDELNSFLGLVRDHTDDQHYKAIVVRIQECIFTAESIIAADPEKNVEGLPQIIEEDVTRLEKEIDKMNEGLEPLNSFILPGGHPVVSFCHVARTVCRRSERTLLRLNEVSKVDEILIRYVNRLSDYLFVLARKLGKDLGAEEIPWKSRG